MPAIFPFLQTAITLAIVLYEFFRGSGLPADRLYAGVFIAYWVHVLISMYSGEFDRYRTRTFLLLSIAILIENVGTFLGYVLPFGQMAYWLASVAPQWLARLLHSSSLGGLESGESLRFYWLLFILILLFIDVLVMQRWTGTASRVFAALAMLATLVLVLPQTGLAPTTVRKVTDFFAVVPHWSALPGFSILRAVPEKLMGVFVLFLAICLPLTVPWFAAERLRSSGIWMLWLLNCAALAAAIVWLGYLGLSGPSRTVIWHSQIATVVFFCCFAVMPYFFRLFVRRAS